MRALLLSSLALSLGPSPVWGKKPPEVVYPTTHDQQTLEDLIKKPVASSNEPAQPAPTPAPMKLEETAPAPAAAVPTPVATQPHPPSSTVPPLPMGEGTSSVKKTSTKTPPTYRVWIWQENGDTLWRIAEKVYGDKDKWPLIYQANRDIIKDPNKIYPKQVLKIPPVDWQP